MNQAVTVLAPVKLAKGITEADLLSASRKFQSDFVAHQPGVIRRELVKKADGSYLDIIQFRSKKDMEDVIKKEQASEICAEFFAIMDMSDAEANFEIMQSLATY